MTLNCILLPESPKWLYSKGRYTECSKALASLARINGVKHTPLINSLKYYKNNESVRSEMPVVNTSDVHSKGPFTELQSL